MATAQVLNDDTLTVKGVKLRKPLNPDAAAPYSGMLSAGGGGLPPSATAAPLNVGGVSAQTPGYAAAPDININPPTPNNQEIQARGIARGLNPGQVYWRNATHGWQQYGKTGDLPPLEATPPHGLLSAGAVPNPLWNTPGMTGAPALLPTVHGPTNLAESWREGGIPGVVSDIAGDVGKIGTEVGGAIGAAGRTAGVAFYGPSAAGADDAPPVAPPVAPSADHLAALNASVTNRTSSPYVPFISKTGLSFEADRLPSGSVGATDADGKPIMLKNDSEYGTGLLPTAARRDVTRRGIVDLRVKQAEQQMEDFNKAQEHAREIADARRVDASPRNFSPYSMAGRNQNIAGLRSEMDAEREAEGARAERIAHEQAVAMGLASAARARPPAPGKIGTEYDADGKRKAEYIVDADNNQIRIGGRELPSELADIDKQILESRANIARGSTGTGWLFGHGGEGEQARITKLIAQRRELAKTLGFDEEEGAMWARPKAPAGAPAGAVARKRDKITGKWIYRDANGNIIG